jgi:hypothetical protein
MGNGLKLLLSIALLLPSMAGCSDQAEQRSEVTSEVRATLDVVPREGLLEVAADTVPSEAVGADVEADAESLPSWYELPFVIERAASGKSMTPEEVTEFTKLITGFYKDVGYFDWIWWTAHGLDKSYDPEMHHYKLYWQDTQAYREGDTVRFSHTGGADNLMIRTSKIMNNVIAGYLMTGDMYFGRVVRDYSRGVAALSIGLEWASENPLVKYLQARAIFTHDHEYETDGGRKVKVEYGEVKQQEVYSWNAHTIPNGENPEYGEIWVRNMRSKDDLPHMFRMVPLLRRVAEEGADAEVRDAATLALEYMEGFAKDIVDEGYYIRTKDKNGVTFIPLLESGIVNDLASFVNFDDVIPGGECNATLSAALVSYHEDKGNECGESDHNLWEDIAVDVHFFNLAIVRFFHLSAITNAIASNEYEVAEELLYGLVKRSDRYMADEVSPDSETAFIPDTAGWLMAAAASGLPLTGTEAALIVQEYSAAANHYATFPHWDPWAEGMAEGPFDYKPSDNGHQEPGNPESGPRRFIRLPEMSFVLEYCFSPWRSPYGAPLLDCEVVADPSKWGE